MEVQADIQWILDQVDGDEFALGWILSIATKFGNERYIHKSAIKRALGNYFFVETMLCDYQKEFLDPDNKSPGEILLKTIGFCFAYNFPAPKWARSSFSESYNKYRSLSDEADSKTPLVSAFQTDPGKHKRRYDKQREAKLKNKVYKFIKIELLRDDKAKVSDLFRDAGNKFSISRELAREWYYEMLHHEEKFELLQNLADEKRQLLNKRPRRKITTLPPAEKKAPVRGSVGVAYKK